MSLSTWNSHSPCRRCFLNLPQGVWNPNGVALCFDLSIAIIIVVAIHRGHQPFLHDLHLVSTLFLHDMCGHYMHMIMRKMQCIAQIHNRASTR